MAVYTHQILIDWNNDGNFANTNSDVTKYLVKSDHTIGRTKFVADNGPVNVAQVGALKFTLRNETKLFSPGNSSSALFGLIKTDIKVKIIETVNFTDQAGNHASGTYTIFYGYIRTITPKSGVTSARTIDFDCEDAIGFLQRTKKSFPLQYNQRADQIIQGLVSTALGAPANTLILTIAIGHNPSNGDTLTLNLPNGTFVLTFTTTSPATVANTILIGATGAVTVANIQAAVTGNAGLNTLYGPNTITQDVTAIADPSVPNVKFTAVVSGNGTCAAFSMSCTNAFVTFNNSGVGTGGVDWPVGLFSYDVSRTILPIAAHRWIKDKTNILTAIQEVVDTEQGRFYQRADGTLVFNNRDHQFNLIAQSALATITNNAAGVDTSPDLVGSMMADEVYGIVHATASPHNTSAQGVVAQPTSGISVPGKGSRTFTLKFFDPDTGQACGVSSLQPLTPFTDWTANERKDGKGVDYTGNANITFSYVIGATSVDMTIINNCIGTLFFPKFQMRGVAVTAYSPVTETVTNNASNKVMTISLPLTEDLDYLNSLALYESNKYGAPTFRYRQMNFGSQPNIYGSPGNVWPVLSLTLGGWVSVTDGQIGITQKCEIIGAHVQLEPTKAVVMYYVQPLDDVTYWLLGDATYGVLGSTTRLAV